MSYFLKCCSFAVFIIFISSFASQDASWIESFQNDEIKIENKLSECNNIANGTNKSYVLLRVTNKMNQEVEVTFSKQLWYDGVCTTCSGDEESKTTVRLKAGETSEGDCETGFKNLKIYHSMKNGSKKILTKFELKNVKVTPLK